MFNNDCYKQPTNSIYFTVLSNTEVSYFEFLSKVFNLVLANKKVFDSLQTEFRQSTLCQKKFFSSKFIATRSKVPGYKKRRKKNFFLKIYDKFCYLIQSIWKLIVDIRSIVLTELIPYCCLLRLLYKKLCLQTINTSH